MTTKQKSISELLAGMNEAERKAALSEAVAAHWPKSTWSNIAPMVIDTAKADVGVGIAMYYKPRRDEPQVVLLKAAGTEQYQIGGGFLNMSATGDRSLQQGAVRETFREELLGANGLPLLDPYTMEERLSKQPMLDFNLITVRGAPRLVTSFALPLKLPEYNTVKSYAAELKASPTLAAKLMKETHGEIDGVGIFPLSTIRKRPGLLRHQDQASLFEKLAVKLHASPKVL